MTVAENIKRIRKEKGLTQKKLGELCNPKISESTIRKYELGILNPKIETLKKIANALQCPVYELKGEISESLSMLDQKIDDIEKINALEKNSMEMLSILAKYSMASEQIKECITECHSASKQVSNYIAKYNLASEQISNYITKYNLDSNKSDIELPLEELENYVLECGAATEQIHNYMAKYHAASKKLDVLCEGKTEDEALSHILEYIAKIQITSDKNTEQEILLTDLANLTSLLDKLNSNGKREATKRIEELTHLKQYTNK